MKKIFYLLLILPLFFTSCKKEEGCTDLQAANYNPDAEEEDGSCLYSLVGSWSMDDYIIAGLSLFSSTHFANPITESVVSFNNDYSFLAATSYADNSLINSTGVWSIIGTSTLRMIDDTGEQVDWTIIEINGSQMEIYVSDLSGLGAATITFSR